jgi:hypothetical protein
MELCEGVTYALEGDKYCIYIGGGIYFFIPVNGLESLKNALIAHYKHTAYLNEFSDEELVILQKKRPKRSYIEEIAYQIERKGYNGKLIKPSDLYSRLPIYSQSRNRNGHQNIADKRWRNALSLGNEKAIHLKSYYKSEERYIKRLFPDIKWIRGSFAISPCHIYPAIKDRGPESWTPDKIVRDLSIINKAFDKISSSKLGGKHAINLEDANIAIEYLKSFEYDQLSITRRILLHILEIRVANGFYDKDIFSDIYLGMEE